jgi:hypothetical protein
MLAELQVQTYCGSALPRIFLISLIIKQAQTQLFAKIKYLRVDPGKNWPTYCVKALMLENHQILTIFEHEGGYFCKDRGEDA